jgi:ribose transport system ATP-binding protein
VEKRFDGIYALRNVDFTVRKGEIHALVGENGAGKSTLMKILCGVYSPDAGSIAMDGSRVEIRDPRQAQHLGISIVHQELSLFVNLTVADNIFSGALPTATPLRMVAKGALRRETRKILDEFGFDLDPFQPIAECGIAERQVVEICKALHRNARLLILDEPTSSLTPNEAGKLFAILRKLRAAGIAIVYISHRLEEIVDMADRVTVLKDGAVVAERLASDVGVQDLIRLMVGREINMSDYYGRRGAPQEEIVLEADNLTRKGMFEGVSFSLRKGEILGLSGLVGAGRTELALALFGALTPDSGSIRIRGRPAGIRSPRQALELKLAYLDEDRKNNSLFPEMSVRENFVVIDLKAGSRFGLMNFRRQAAETGEFVRRLNIQTSGPDQRIADLSGGNQQKVVIARLLAINPEILICDEPTRGIDVGAKREIYLLLSSLVAHGMSIILISSEMPEIIGMSHRVMALRNGRVSGFLGGAGVTEENIMRLAAGRAG